MAITSVAPALCWSVLAVVGAFGVLARWANLLARLGPIRCGLKVMVHRLGQSPSRSMWVDCSLPLLAVAGLSRHWSICRSLPWPNCRLVAGRRVVASVLVVLVLPCALCLL